MSLKAEESHKKIDVTSLDTKNKKKHKVKVGPVLLSLVLLSGCNAGKIVDKLSSSKEGPSYVQEIDGKRVYNIPEPKYGDIINLEGASNITLIDGSKFEGTRMYYEDLDKIACIAISVNDGWNYDYINYLTGLKALTIQNHSEKKLLNNIDGSRLPAGIKISVSDYGVSIDAGLNEDYYPFLKEISSIDYLEVGYDKFTCDLSSGYINKLDNVKNLCIYVDEYVNMKNFDFSHLDTLTIKGKPYDIAMYISNDDLVKISDSGVDVYVDNYEKVAEISQQLDEIYSSLNVSDNATDKEKIDAIVSYVLDKCTYDKEVDNRLSKGKNCDELGKTFSVDGELDAVFNKDSQICVNYAALVTALGKRAGIDAFFTVSDSHAWNTVKLGDYYYCLDTTFMDMEYLEIKTRQTNKDGSYLDIGTYSASDIFKVDNDEQKNKFYGYMEDPTDVYESAATKGTHDMRFVPDGIDLKKIPSEEREKQLGAMFNYENSGNDSQLVYEDGSVVPSKKVVDVTNKIFSVLFNGKTYLISGTVLIGLLMAFGKASKKKKKEKEELNTNVESIGRSK